MRQISTGDLFRAAIKKGTALGKSAKSFVDAGNLVPDEITIGLVDEVLRTLNGQPFILDGFPRTVTQAKALEQQLAKYHLSVGAALFLEVPRADVVGRLAGRRVCGKCGATYHAQAKPTRVEGVCDVCGGKVEQRKDDREDVIRTRLLAYEESTYPLRDYFRAAGTYVEIDGLGDTEVVFERVKAALKGKATA
jgi:adenylate kinase